MNPDDNEGGLCCVFSFCLTSWRSRTTSASGSKRKAWWGCPAKQVGNQEERRKTQSLHRRPTPRLQKYYCKFLNCCCFHSVVEMLQHHCDFPVSGRRADQPARPHPCRHRLHHRSMQTETDSKHPHIQTQMEEQCLGLFLKLKCK